jgi:hypothetical protein
MSVYLLAHFAPYGIAQNVCKDVEDRLLTAGEGVPAVLMALNETRILMVKFGPWVKSLDEIEEGCYLIDVGHHVVLFFKVLGQPAIIVDPHDGKAQYFNSKTFNSDYDVVTGGTKTTIYELTDQGNVKAHHRYRSGCTLYCAHHAHCTHNKWTLCYTV